MSYEGTYGPNETCPHDRYWRSCEYCSTLGARPTPEQIAQARVKQAERKQFYLDHPVLARRIVVASHAITVYDAGCPAHGCGWQLWNVLSRGALDAAILEHIMQCDKIAAQWANVDPNEAYVEPVK
jgi:hypothetical protein